MVMKLIRIVLLCVSSILVTLQLRSVLDKSPEGNPLRISRPFYTVNHGQPEVMCQQETRHVYFLKVHKSGSTSLQNLMLRFGLSRNLNVLTIFTETFFSYPHAKFHNKLPSVRPKDLLNGKYDMYCEHSIYNEEYLGKLLQEDTVNIAIVREPWSQFISSFGYYSLVKKLSIEQLPNPFAHFVENIKYYASFNRTRVMEVTHNRVALEFGFLEGVHNFEEYLKYIDSKFLVLISERFSESLVLMKRKLCWEMKDILYSRARTRSYERPAINATLVALHKAWSPRDYAIYEYFSGVMEQRIAAEDNDFAGEVAVFEGYLAKTREFCDMVCAHMATLVKPINREAITSLLHHGRLFAATKWGSAFTITGLDCLMMRVDPAIYRGMQKIRLFPEFCSHKDPKISSLNIDPLFCDDIFHNSIPWTFIEKPQFTSPCYKN